MADDVQSPEGDQGGDADLGLYDLDSVDPAVRDQLTPHLKAIEGNVTKKFQEGAEYRKGWEPYEALGIQDMDPAALQQLLDFAQITTDPDQFSQWWKAVGDHMGFFQGQGSNNEDLGLEDFDGLDGLTQEQVKELIEASIAERLSPLEENLQSQERDKRVQAAGEELDAALGTIEADNAALFGGDAEEKQEVKDQILRLALTYSEGDENLTGEEIIAKAFEDYKALLAKGEKGLFDQKNGQPDPPEGPGSADLSPEKITSFSDPRLKDAALARLRKS
jgi:hypothetical protein